MSSLSKVPRVAVLYQALEPPVINGITKPKKPGGYKDSSADIAFVLRDCCGMDVTTPWTNPKPSEDEGWSFADTEEGILAAVSDHRASVLWANTVLYKDHPLQTSSALDKFVDQVSVIGQPPALVDFYDDKAFVNQLLRSQGDLTLPVSVTVTSDDLVLENLNSLLSSHGLHFPLVAKPVRGRGSHGVKLCHDPQGLMNHATVLFTESLSIILEEYLSGVEGTVTVMPPSQGRPGYWTLPTVMRFNHKDGVAPYNGIVAVNMNSRTVSPDEAASDIMYSRAARECVQVARLLQVTAPIRIDIRKRSDDSAAPFALFDINMKPNMTGPGRPGREDQASLSAMAAASIGWDYPRLLKHIISTARPLRELRSKSIA